MKFLIFKKKYFFFQKFLKLTRVRLLSCHVTAYNHDT